MDKYDLKHDDFELRQLSKACVIGLGYGMGAAKFLTTTEAKGTKIPPRAKELWDFTKWDKAAMTRLGLDPENPKHEKQVCSFMGAVYVVRQWRAVNEKLTGKKGLWKNLDTELKNAARVKAAVHIFNMPCGRPKPYFHPRMENRPVLVVDKITGKKTTEIETRLLASHTRGRKASSLFGGKITENIVQSIARDVMFHGALDILEEEPVWKFLWNAYDEVIFEVPTCDIERAKEVMPRCLCAGRASKWAPGLPLKVTGGPADRYEK